VVAAQPRLVQDSIDRDSSAPAELHARRPTPFVIAGEKHSEGFFLVFVEIGKDERTWACLAGAPRMTGDVDAGTGAFTFAGRRSIRACLVTAMIRPVLRLALLTALAASVSDRTPRDLYEVAEAAAGGFTVKVSGFRTSRMIHEA